MWHRFVPTEVLKVRKYRRSPVWLLALSDFDLQRTPFLMLRGGNTLLFPQAFVVRLSHAARTLRVMDGYS